MPAWNYHMTVKEEEILQIMIVLGVCNGLLHAIT